MARLLAEQRAQLELEARKRLEAVEEQLREALAKLAEQKTRPKSPSTPPQRPGSADKGGGGLKSIRLVYDPNMPVVDQLRKALAESNTRVLDLFREWDGDNDGRISKKDFRVGFTKMAPDFPKDVVDATFDSFDPDGSGEIEFNELDKFLRKRASTVPESAAKKGWGKAAAAAGAKKVLTAKKPLTGIAAVVSKIAANATGLVPAADDLEGDGKEDFYSRMKKRANDYFAADADGDSKLDFDEFVAMVAQRDDAKDFKQDQLRTLFDALDIDKSGKLDLNEYIQWALRESLGKSRGKVIDLFRAWDEDGSGMIDMKEFSTVLFALGFRCSMKDCQAVFDSFDTDGGGQIEYKELNSSLRKGTTLSKLEPKPPAGAKPGKAPVRRGGK